MLPYNQDSYWMASSLARVLLSPVGGRRVVAAAHNKSVNVCTRSVVYLGVLCLYPVE